MEISQKKYRSQILVPVSPQKLRAKDGRAKMETRDKNPHPVHYKVDTSSMEALSVCSENGYIPSKSKVSVYIEHESATRRQEAVFAQKPGWKATRDDKIIHPNHGLAVQRKRFDTIDLTTEQNHFSKEISNNLKFSKNVRVRKARSDESLHKSHKSIKGTNPSPNAVKREDKVSSDKVTENIKGLTTEPEMEQICLHALVDRKFGNRRQRDCCADLASVSNLQGCRNCYTREIFPCFNCRCKVNKQKRQIKYITEEEFMKRRAKAMQKKCSTALETISEDASENHSLDNKAIKAYGGGCGQEDAELTMVSIDEKCSFLLQLFWVNFLFTTVSSAVIVGFIFGWFM